MRLRPLPFLVAFLFLVWLSPSPALAFIPHYDPVEAFFIRELALFFFFCAMLFFIYEIRREGLRAQRGFRCLRMAAILFAVWNVDLFVGHWGDILVEKSNYIGSPGTLGQWLQMTDLSAWVYYFTKMDHLLLVPAYYCLYRGIKAFRLGQERGGR